MAPKVNKTIIHQNVNGIRTHTTEKVHTLTQAYIISIHDTRLKQDQNMLQSMFQHYIVHEIKHDKNTGIALLIHRTIKHTLISKFNQNGHKSITIKIHDSKIFHTDLHITSCFVPPRSSRHKTLLQTNILQNALQYRHAIITDDLNARHRHWLPRHQSPRQTTSQISHQLRSHYS